MEETLAPVRQVAFLHFYNLLIKGEFVVVDLGTAAEFQQGRLLGAQHFPSGAARFVDELGYERRDKVLAYAHESDVDATDARIDHLRRQKHAKEVLVLEGGAARFIGIYPFLRENNDRSGMEFVVYPSQILPSPSGLFLGSQITTTNRKVLQDLGITHIVNVTNEVVNEFEFDEALGIVYHRFSVADEVTENIFRFFHSAREIIDKARHAGGNVLVHCAHGRSRSATIVTAYLMLSQQWDVETAYNHVRSLRDVVRANEGFLRQLHILDADRKETDLLET